MILEHRGSSQILFGFLPEQTVDLRNKTWKVQRWSNPNFLTVDQSFVQQELLSAIRPWSNDGLDGNLRARLLSGVDVQIVSPSRSGIEVEPFPRLYRCRACGRLEKSERTCKCGARAWGSFPFVAYHTCGLLREPFIRVCPEHREVRTLLPKSNNARDIKFDCPVCKKIVQDGFLWNKCECGDGQLMYNVHRAGTVFSPHGTVIVNPPDTEMSQSLSSTAARMNALEWALGGMAERKPTDRRLTLEALIEVFKASGIPVGQAEAMAKAAAASSGGALGDGRQELPLFGDLKDQAIDGALKLAYATAGGRKMLADLQSVADSASIERYSHSYPEAIAAAKLSSVELLDRFPVLSVQFGYTRGDVRGKKAHLRWFKDENGNPRLFGQRVETEALHFRLDPVLVARWLNSCGHLPVAPQEPNEARLAIAQHCRIPFLGDPVDEANSGLALMRAIHSYAHRMIRVIAAYAGLDRDALAEYIVPVHLSFMIYARSSNFILGGLQALFENNLDSALHEFVRSDTRCALDPGCSHSGSACMACIHLGEPSCRFFNQMLSRKALFGAQGFLEQPVVAPA